MNLKTMSPLLLIAIIITALLGAIGIIWAFGQISISGSGTVVASAAAVTATPTSFDWGTITQGTSKNFTITLTNNGGTPTDTLLIDVTMPAGSGLTLEYDSAIAIPAHGGRGVVFTLTAAPTTTIGEFTHTVTIDG